VISLRALNAPPAVNAQAAEQSYIAIRTIDQTAGATDEKIDSRLQLRCPIDYQI
jgi:hypothetical protein